MHVPAAAVSHLRARARRQRWLTMHARAFAAAVANCVHVPRQRWLTCTCLRQRCLTCVQARRQRWLTMHVTAAAVSHGGQRGRLLGQLCIGQRQCMPHLASPRRRGRLQRAGGCLRAEPEKAVSARAAARARAKRVHHEVEKKEEAVHAHRVDALSKQGKVANLVNSFRCYFAS